MLKSAWAYNNGKRMMAECKKALAPKEMEFVNKRGAMLYAERGVVKTYANKKQADNKVKSLVSAGHNVSRSLRHPYTIILISG